MEQYVDMMIASLHKKIELLDQILEMNRQLEQLAQQPDMELERFRELLDGREVYVQQINQQDEGFQSLFDKVKEALQSDRSTYREQIRTMQELIRDITARTVQLEELEEKSRLLIEGQFARMHREVQTAKKGMNVAQNYYKSMSKTGVVDAQFLDKKN